MLIDGTNTLSTRMPPEEEAARYLSSQQGGKKLATDRQKSNEDR
jgi:hypothetical protein